MLMMPVIDDLLKQEAFKEIVIDAKGGSRDSTTFMQALTPQKNVEKAIHFIKSKFGVGVVALDITGHAVFMVDHIDVNPVYNNPSNDFKSTSTSLMFRGLEGNYTLSSMYDAKNRIISEVQSQTMNSQVDAGKDPYAVLLGINNQTLGIMMYLVRRGVPVIQVLKLLSQPMVEQYLINQRKNESIINKQRGNESNKKELIDELYQQNGLIKPGVLNRNDLFNESDLEDGIKRGKIDQRQIKFFEYFLALVDETGSFNDLKNGMTVDTKGKKDKAAVESFEALWEKIRKTKIVTDESLAKLKDNSVLSPFFRAQDLYRNLYFPFYAFEKSDFGSKLKTFKDMLSDRQKGVPKKEKVRNAIDNDFLMFLIQNFNSDFNLGSFDKLFGLTSDPSLAEQIKRLSENSNNPVLKALFPLLSITKDEISGKGIDAIRLFERELSAIDLNDFVDSMKDVRDEISEELYKSIIQIGLYQAGFNNSPFSLNKVFPTFRSTTRDAKGNLVDFQNDYLREIQVGVLKLLPQIQVNADVLFDQFIDLFYRNNTDVLPKRYSQYSPVRYFYTFNKETKKRVLFYKLDNATPLTYLSPLGGTYFKRYFTSLASGLNAPLVAEESVPLKNERQLTELDVDLLYNNIKQITKKYSSTTLADSIDYTLKTPLIFGDTRITAIEPRAGDTSYIWFERPGVKQLISIEERNGKQYLNLSKINDKGTYYTQQLSEKDLQDFINISGLKPLINSIYQDTNIKQPENRRDQFEIQNALQQKYNLKRSYKDIADNLKQLDLFAVAEENERQLQIPTMIKEVVNGAEGSEVVNENVINESKSLKQEVLQNFDKYFPDYSHYNDEQREIIADAVERGDIQIICNF